MFWLYSPFFATLCRSAPISHIPTLSLQKSRPICSPQIVDMWLFHWRMFDLPSSTNKENWLSVFQMTTTVYSPTDKGGISGPSPLSMLGFGMTWACIRLGYSITVLPQIYPPPLALILSTPSSTMKIRKEEEEEFHNIWIRNGLKKTPSDFEKLYH